MSKQRYISPAASGAVHTHQGTEDSNNCVVRAIANCAGAEYDRIHIEAKKAGRVNHKGMHTDQWFPLVVKYTDGKVVQVGDTCTSRCFGRVAEKFNRKPLVSKGMTIATMLTKPEYKQGTWFVLVIGHVFCLQDGKILDIGYNKANTRVCGLVKFD